MKTLLVATVGLCMLATAGMTESCPAHMVWTDPHDSENAKDADLPHPVLHKAKSSGWHQLGGFHLPARHQMAADGRMMRSPALDDGALAAVTATAEIILRPTVCIMPIVQETNDMTSQLGPDQSQWSDSGVDPSIILIATGVVRVAMHVAPMEELP